MIDNLGELIFIQIICLTLLIIIIVATLKLGRKGIFYWIIAGLYTLTLIWLVFEYTNFGPKPDPGSVFVWGTLSMIIPSILVGMALVVFVISRMFK
jgi:hypothetical protein